MFEMLTAFAVGLVVLCLVGKIISLPLQLVWKLITNSIIGAILLGWSRSSPSRCRSHS